MQDETTLDEPSVEDKLSELCTCLVSLSRYEPGLVLLFARPPGSWQTVGSLWIVDDSYAAPESATLMVSWIPAPEDANDSYALLIFYHFTLLWPFTAYYNKGRLVGDTAPLP